MLCWLVFKGPYLKLTIFTPFLERVHMFCMSLIGHVSKELIVRSFVCDVKGLSVITIFIVCRLRFLRLKIAEDG